VHIHIDILGQLALRVIYIRRERLYHCDECLQWETYCA